MDNQAFDLDSMANALRRLRDFILFTEFDSLTADMALTRLKLAGIEARTKPVYVNLEKHLGFDHEFFGELLGSQLRREPWRLTWYGDGGIESGERLIVLLEPDMKKRKQLEMQGRIDQDSLDNVPVLLLNAAVDDVASNQLKTIVGSISSHTRTDFLPEPIRWHNALNYLVAQYLYDREAFNCCFGIPYTRELARASLEPSSHPLYRLIDQEAIRAVLQSPTAVRRCAEVEAHGQRPTFALYDILEYWQRHSSELLSRPVITLHTAKAFVSWSSIPATRIAYDDWMEFIERNELEEHIPTVELNYEEWKIVARVRSAMCGGLGEALTHKNVFVKTGDGWFVRYDGEEGIFPNLNGMRYINRLLQAPNSRIGSMEFIDIDTDSGHVSAGDLREIGGTTGSQVGLMATDQQAAREVNREIRKLEKQLSGVLPEKERRAKEKALRQCREYLGQTVGKSGRPRKVSDGREKSRKSVYAAIDACIQRISESMPKTAEHLKVAIRTGNFCFYRPSTPVNWHTQ